MSKDHTYKIFNEAQTLSMVDLKGWVVTSEVFAAKAGKFNG